MFVPPGMLRPLASVCGLKAAQFCFSPFSLHPLGFPPGMVWESLAQAFPSGSSLDGFLGWQRGVWNSCGIPGPRRGSGMLPASDREKIWEFLHKTAHSKAVAPSPSCSHPRPPGEWISRERDFILGSLPGGSSQLPLGLFPLPHVDLGREKSGMWHIGTAGKQQQIPAGSTWDLPQEGLGHQPWARGGPLGFRSAPGSQKLSKGTTRGKTMEKRGSLRCCPLHQQSSSPRASRIPTRIRSSAAPAPLRASLGTW